MSFQLVISFPLDHTLFSNMLDGRPEILGIPELAQRNVHTATKCAPGCTNGKHRVTALDYMAAKFIKSEVDLNKLPAFVNAILNSEDFAEFPSKNKDNLVGPITNALIKCGNVRARELAAG